MARVGAGQVLPLVPFDALKNRVDLLRVLVVGLDEVREGTLHVKRGDAFERVVIDVVSDEFLHHGVADHTLDIRKQLCPLVVGDT